AAFGSVEPQEELGQAGLAAAVAAGQEDHLSRLEGKIERSQEKGAPLLLAEIAVGHAGELQPPPARGGRHAALRLHPLALLAEREPELPDLARRDARAREARDRTP